MQEKHLHMYTKRPIPRPFITDETKRNAQAQMPIRKLNGQINFGISVLWNIVYKSKRVSISTYYNMGRYPRHTIEWKQQAADLIQYYKLWGVYRCLCVEAYKFTEGWVSVANSPFGYLGQREWIRLKIETYQLALSMGNIV